MTRPAPLDDTTYQSVILVVSILALLFLGIETTVALDQGTRTILRWADNAICVLFFADFVRQLRRAPDRRA